MSQHAPTVHAWGFFDDDGRRKIPNGIAVSDVGVYATHTQLARHIRYFGGDITDLRTTRTLDGLLVATEFEAAAHDRTARIWHVVQLAKDSWPDKPDLSREPETNDDDSTDLEEAS